MVYGWRVASADDPRMAQLFESMARFLIMIQKPVSIMLEAFPFLRHLPLLFPVITEARAHHKSEAALYEKYWFDCKKRIRDSLAPACFCVDMARAQDESKFSDKLAAYSAGSMLEAGSDTTSATLYAFVAAMVLFPEAQAQIQSELDRVIGISRLPTWEDSPNLP
jgi:cytochrome P450